MNRMTLHILVFIISTLLCAQIYSEVAELTAFHNQLKQLADRLSVSAKELSTQAPTLTEAEIKKYTSKPEQSAEERIQQLEKDIRRAREAAQKQKTVAAQASGLKESKAAKESQALGAPMTRNLIMLFDTGSDNGPLLTGLTTALLQQNAFIIVNSRLWQLFTVTKVKTVFTREGGSPKDEQALEKSLGDKSCADIFFSFNTWDMYSVEGRDTKMGIQDTLYVLVPRQYKTALLSYTQNDVSGIGIKVDVLTPIRSLAESLNRLFSSPASEQYRKGEVVADALRQVLHADARYSWNVYLNGHGLRGDRDTGMIAGLNLPAFEGIINFFDKKVQTNFLFYSTCFGGGEHLVAPFIIGGLPMNLTYPVAAGALLDVITYTWSGCLSMLPKSSLSMTYMSKFSVGVLASLLGQPVYFFSPKNFETFFNGLETFALGTSNNIDFIRALNAVENFLTPDLQKVVFFQNIPQIRFPHTTWFDSMRLTKGLPLIHLTRAKVMARNFDALYHNQPWELNVTGDQIVLLQTPDIAIPLMIDAKTQLVPLIHSVSFLQKKPLIINNKQMPSLIAFTAPITTQSGLFSILASLWILPPKKELSNIAWFIATLICRNDLDASQQKMVTSEAVLGLEYVMIFPNTANPLDPSIKNSVVFGFKGKFYLLNMDKERDKLSQLDAKTTQYYQVLYKQSFAYCLDPEVEPLLVANMKKDLDRLAEKRRVEKRGF